MTRKGGSLAGNTLHHVAIAAHCVNIIVKHREFWPIEVMR